MDVSGLSVSRRHRHKTRTQGRARLDSGRAGDKQNNAPGDSGGRQCPSAQGGCQQRSSCPDSLAASEPRQAGRQRRRVRSGAALPQAAFPLSSLGPAAPWCRRTGKGHQRNDGGPAPALGCSGEPPQARRRKVRGARRDACPGYSARGRMRSSWSGHGHPQLCKQPR